MKHTYQNTYSQEEEMEKSMDEINLEKLLELNNKERRSQLLRKENKQGEPL